MSAVGDRALDYVQSWLVRVCDVNPCMVVLVVDVEAHQQAGSDQGRAHGGQTVHGDVDPLAKGLAIQRYVDGW